MAPKKRAKRRPTDAKIQIRTFPENVNELIVDHVEDNNIPHSQIEIVDEDAIIIHNKEN